MSKRGAHREIAFEFKALKVAALVRTLTLVLPSMHVGKIWTNEPEL